MKKKVGKITIILNLRLFAIKQRIAKSFLIRRKQVTFKLSNQAVGALMLALQKGLMEQTDITEMIKGFELSNSVDGLIVENPPMVEVKEPEQETVA